MATGGTGQIHDEIGVGSSAQRQADTRLARLLFAALGAGRVLNVGAGAGSYEPPGRKVVAAEPSAVIIAQRPPGTAPVVQVAAEPLPFPSRSFDVAMAVLTVHHRTDRSAGFRELALAKDLRSGLSHERHGHLLHCEELDCGLRLLVGETA